MYTQHSEMKMGQVVEIVGKKPLVKLLSQHGDGKCVFVHGVDGEAMSLPSNEFFMLHREATPREMAAETAKTAKAAEPAK